MKRRDPSQLALGRALRALTPDGAQAFARAVADLVDAHAKIAPLVAQLYGLSLDARGALRGARPGSNIANDARSIDALERTRRAGHAIVSYLRPGVWTPRRDLRDIGGEGLRAAERALARLVAAGFVEHRRGRIAITQAGARATGAVVDGVLDSPGARGAPC